METQVELSRDERLSLAREIAADKREKYIARVFSGVP